MAAKGTAPCRVGTLDQVKFGHADVTSSGLQWKDLHQVRGRMLTPAQFEKHLAKEAAKPAKANAKPPARKRAPRKKPPEPEPAHGIPELAPMYPDRPFSIGFHGWAGPDGRLINPARLPQLWAEYEARQAAQGGNYAARPTK